MSVETITVIISTATLLLAFLGVIGWLVGRVDRLGDKLMARIDAVDDKVTARIDAVDDKLTARLDAVERELVEVKIGIARLEGPPHRLLPAR